MFFKIIVWAVVLIKCCGLSMLVLENVEGILTEADGRVSAMEHSLTVLRHFCPEFTFSFNKLKLRVHPGCQSRVRVFLRGMRKKFASEVPAPLAPFGERSIRDLLGRFPCTPRTVWTKTQQRNLLKIESRIRYRVRERTLKLSDVVVCSPDRAFTRTCPQSLSVNHLPTLTTSNQYLFVISVGDCVKRVEDSKREFFRKVVPTARLTSMAFPRKLRLKLKGKTVFAAGKACPVQLIVAVIYPMLAALGENGLLDVEGGLSHLPECLPDVEKALRKAFAKKKTAKQVKATKQKPKLGKPMKAIKKRT